MKEKARVAYELANAKYKLSRLNNSSGKPVATFKPGDLLMLWRQKNKPGKVSGSWIGPCRLLLQEGGTLWLATGATLIRARHNQVRSCTKREEMTAMLEGTAILSTPVTVESLMRHFTGKHYMNVTGEVPSERQRQEDVTGAEITLEHRPGFQLDAWKIEIMQGKRWLVRLHRLPRLTLFTPSRTGNSPFNEDQLTGKRITIVQPMIDGAEEKIIEDDFKEDEAPLRQLQERWQGQTRFEVKIDAKKELAKKRIPDPSVEDRPSKVPTPAAPAASSPNGLPASSSTPDGPECRVPGCCLRGGHSGPHQDQHDRKFSWEPYSGRVDLEPEESQMDASSDSSDSSEELLPDEKKRRLDDKPDDEEKSVAYSLEIPMEPEDVQYLANHPRKAAIWMSKKLDAKTKELSWNKMPLDQKMRFDVAQARELTQVITSKALRSLTKQEADSLDARRVMQMRWVLTVKGDGSPGNEKARLVVLGYQAPNLTEVQASAPTMSRLSRNLMLMVCANMKFKMQSGDVSSAFLQADQSLEQEDLVVWAPPELATLFGANPSNPVLPLKICKAFYGLVHAPRKWFDHVAATLRSQGWRQMLSDKCLFALYKPDEHGRDQLIGLAGLHVDDFLVCGDEHDAVFLEAEQKLRASYRWGEWESSSFTFAGCDLQQHSDYSITINQDTYVQKWLDEIEITKEREGQRNSPLTPDEVSKLRGAIGTLSWKASQSGPQYMADVSLLLSEIPYSTVETILKTNKLIREVKRGSNQSLRFPSEGIPWQDLSVITWADASQHNRPDRSSTLGLVTGIAHRDIMAGEERSVAIVNWRSGRTPRQCLGSNGAEVQSITEGEDATFRIRALIAEIHGVVFLDKQDMYQKVATLTSGAIVMDSRGVYDAMVRNMSALHGLRSSRAGYELALSVCQAVQIGTQMRWVNGNAQIADTLTKFNSRKALLQLLANGQRWKLIHDENFVSGRKLKKAELLKKLNEQQAFFVEEVRKMAMKQRWPWLESAELEESRNGVDETIRLPLHF
eukprot:Skav203992  [mRNA]  locus=scaffold3297:153239:156406:+ [translate_table: standard]